MPSPSWAKLSSSNIGVACEGSHRCGDLEAGPSKVNEDATGQGWLFKITLSDPSELDDLMDEAAYKGYVEELG